MESIRRRYNDWPIKSKLVSIILIGLFMMSCVCLTGLQVANHSNQQFLYQTLASSLSYSAKELRDSFKAIETLSFHVATDMTVQEHLAMLKEAPDDIVVRSNAFRQLNTSLLHYYEQGRAINYISLECDAINLATDSVRENKLPQEYRQEMRDAAIAADGQAVWIYNTEIEGSLSAVRGVKRIAPFWRDDLGVVTINIEIDKLVEDSTEFSDRFGQACYILMNDDHVLFATDNFTDGLRQQAEQMTGDDYQVIKDNGHRYFAVAGTVPEYGWRYVNLVLYDETYQAIRNSMLYNLLTLLAGAGLTIALCRMLVERLTAHISSLLEKMQKFSHGNDAAPATAYDYSGRKDELGILHQQFDRMAKEIIDLIQNDYMNQILVKDAQLKALEAQIDPHFLYNVLQNISWSARASGNTKIMEMVDTLGKMLRTTLSRDDETFTIGREAEFVSNYMTIQKYRFDGQLKFSMDIPAELFAVRIPKLTIQPLVENAIRYGMEESDEICEIEVTGAVAENEIVISVKNGGSEFADHLLAKLEQGQIRPNGFGIGLQNIQQRLHLFQKGSYLELLNEDQMAVARVHIAMEKPGEDSLDLC